MGFLDFLFGDGRNQGRGTAVRGTAEAHGREVWASGTTDDGTYWEKGGEGVQHPTAVRFTSLRAGGSG